jgi:hypothetical protein
MEGPQKNFTNEGLEGERHGPRSENLDHQGQTERAEISIRGIFDKNMEAPSVIRRIMEENKSSFSGLEERTL